MNRTANKYQTILICVFLVVSTLSVYRQVLECEFVNFDDTIYVTENEHVNTGLSWDNTKWAFKAGKVGYWHPLTWLSHMLDCELYGVKPGMHHLTNLVIHIANSLLLFLLLQRLTSSLWKSAFVAALFALHPINVDSVAWVAERKNVLSTLFWILTIWAYTSYVRRGGILRYLITLLIFALGLLAKPMLVTLPFVMLLLDYWPYERIRFGIYSKRDKSAPAGKRKTTIPGLVWEKAPFFALSAVSVYLSSLSTKLLGITISTEWVPMKLRAANALVSYARYIGKAFWPQGLAVFYPFPKAVPLWQGMGALAILLVLSFVLVWVLREKRYLGVGWLWFLGTLLPVSGLVQAGLWPAMADRWAYVPLVGIFIATAWGIGDLAGKWRLHKYLLVSGAGVCISALMVCTLLQVRYWQNGFTLFTRALEVTSDNPIAHLNLGNVLLKEQKIDEAIAHYKRAIEIYKDHVEAHFNLGLALELDKKYDEAIEEYFTVLRLKEDHWKASFHMGNAFSKKGMLDEAISHYYKALQLKPDDIEVHFNLGSALVKKGAINEGVKHYNKALEINPHSVEVLNNLGNALSRQKRYSEAVKHYRNALNLKPNFSETHYNLARALKQTGKVDEAVVHYQEAVQLKPDDIDSHYGLGLCLAELKKYDEASVHYEKAIQLNPNFAPAYYNLGIIFASQNETPKAIEQFRQVLRIHPDDAVMHCNLGILLAQVGSVDEAVKEFRTALRLDPNLSEAREELDTALKRLTKPDISP